MAERHGRQRDIHDELGFRPMPEIGGGGADGKLRMGLQEAAFLARGGFATGGARKDCGVTGGDLAFDLIP